MVYEAADDRMADMARRLDPLGKKSLHRYLNNNYVYISLHFTVIPEGYALAYRKALTNGN